MNAPRDAVISASAPIHAALLAAGGSSRLGRPKQLVQLGGQSLLRRAAELTLAARVASVTVILGAHAGAMEREIEGLPVHAVCNEEWQSGMGSSIRCAARDSHAPADAALLFVLCDQLHLTTAHLDALIAALRAGRGAIVASGYAGAIGVPALFSAAYRDELRALPDAEQGRDLLRRHAAHVDVVPLHLGDRDLDTEADLHAAAGSTHLERPDRSEEGSRA
jgi:molybdenum cofactor cytidylyltransferase